MLLVNNEINTTFISADMKNKIRFILRLLRPVKIDEFDKIRVGSELDGGYVQRDDYKRLSMALSLGIGANDEWDLATARKVIPVKQCNHPIDFAPSNHPLMEFSSTIISAIRSLDSITLPELVARHEDRDPSNIILKIDVEGEEWSVFDCVDDATLARFAQIICEFHHLHKLHESEFYGKALRLRLRVFAKLNELSVLFHVHANNFASIVNIGNVPIPQTLEVSLANRHCYSFKDSDENFPTARDRPNNPALADIFLGRFRA